MKKPLSLDENKMNFQYEPQEKQVHAKAIIKLNQLNQ